MFKNFLKKKKKKVVNNKNILVAALLYMQLKLMKIIQKLKKKLLKGQ